MAEEIRDFIDLKAKEEAMVEYEDNNHFEVEDIPIAIIPKKKKKKFTINLHINLHLLSNLSKLMFLRSMNFLKTSMKY